MTKEKTVEYDFKTFMFGSGSHQTREQGMCVMEAVAYVAGESHSDTPACACPVLSTFMRSWNDGLPSDEERNRLLGQYVFRLVGTKDTRQVEERRAWMAADWLTRECVPAFLDLNDSLRTHAAALRAHPEIDCLDRACSIVPTLTAAKEDTAAAWAAARSAGRSAAWAAARSAAWGASWDAAWAAARSAAWGASWDAAWAAAWAAAWDAAWAAARDAARGAAWGAVQLTVDRLQASAHELLDRMISLTERERACPPSLESVSV